MNAWWTANSTEGAAVGPEGLSAEPGASVVDNMDVDPSTDARPGASGVRSPVDTVAKAASDVSGVGGFGESGGSGVHPPGVQEGMTVDPTTAGSRDPAMGSRGTPYGKARMTVRMRGATSGRARGEMRGTVPRTHTARSTTRATNSPQRSPHNDDADSNSADDDIVARAKDITISADDPEVEHPEDEQMDVRTLVCGAQRLLAKGTHNCTDEASHGARGHEEASRARPLCPDQAGDGRVGKVVLPNTIPSGRPGRWSIYITHMYC